MTAARPLRVVVYDSAERGWPWLVVWWAIGARVLQALRLVSRDAVVIPARSWDEAYPRIESAVRRNPGRAVDLQVWGHGYQGAPLIAGKGPSLPLLADALEDAPRDVSSVWFRSCDVAEGRAGHEFMLDAVSHLQVPVYAHCAVISLPYPWRQDEICCLTPGDLAEGGVWWSLTGEELPSCSTLRMTPPTFAHRPHP